MVLGTGRYPCTVTPDATRTHGDDLVDDVGRVKHECFSVQMNQKHDRNPLKKMIENKLVCPSLWVSM
jgi:hypothetical protein